MMMSARDHVKAEYRLGLRRFCVFRCSGKNSPQRGFPALDAGDKKLNRRLVAPTRINNSSSQQTCGELFPLSATTLRQPTTQRKQLNSLVQSVLTTSDWL